MTVQLEQDKNYIEKVRDHATKLWMAAEGGALDGEEWNSCFGAEARLAEPFSDPNDGLTKTDIENAVNLITALNTWLDEAGYDRRVNLMKVAKI